MHRRRLMHASDDWLEVVDVERPRVEISIPADHIHRMMVERDLVQTVVLLHDEREVTLLVDRLELHRAANVALRIGRPLFQLAELVAIALGRADVSAALEDEEFLLDLLVQAEAM